MRARLHVAAFVVLGAAVGTWFVVAPHLGRVSLWPDIAIVAGGVLPATFALVLVALPLARWPRELLVAAVLLALIAFGCTEAGWELAANFAKLWAAVFAGWAFLRLFEELSWVVLVAVIIPVVDAISVAWGPTHTLTNKHNFHIYRGFAVAFLAPHQGAALLGPPDILFFALFLAAAARFRLRPFWTWVGMTGMYSFTIVLTYVISVDGLPALPFLSFGFLVANADLLWRRLRKPRAADGQTDA